MLQNIFIYVQKRVTLTNHYKFYIENLSHHLFSSTVPLLGPKLFEVISNFITNTPIANESNLNNIIFIITRRKLEYLMLMNTKILIYIFLNIGT